MRTTDALNYDGFRTTVFDKEFTDFGPGEIVAAITVGLIRRPDNTYSVLVCSGNNPEAGDSQRLPKRYEIALLEAGRDAICQQ